MKNNIDVTNTIKVISNRNKQNKNIYINIVIYTINQSYQ